jgi:azurin
MKVNSSDPIDLYSTVHKLASPFTEFSGYQPVAKTIAAHPILADLAATRNVTPNPWKKKIPGARALMIEARTNLTYSKPTLEARAGEPIRLTFTNPDVVPHNWALIKPGTLSKVGDLANKLIADPEALSRQYVPKTDDVLAYTDIVAPSDSFWIEFRAPNEPGRYPFLCTFPGHWMVMNGVLIVR